MNTINQDRFFDNLINGMDSKLQGQLRYFYTKESRLDKYRQRQKYEAFKQEIAEYVINHIVAKVDIEDILNKIDELNRKIEKLGE